MGINSPTSPKLRRRRSDSAGGAASPLAEGAATAADGGAPAAGAAAAGAGAAVGAEQQVAPPPPAPEGRDWGKWWRRWWTTMGMIFGFLGYLLVTKHAGIVLFIFVLQANIYRELVRLTLHDARERDLPGFHIFYAYWFLVAALFLYGRTLIPHFRAHPPLEWLGVLFELHTSICFGLYMLGFVAFVVSLKKRRHYKYQFSQFAYCHIALFIVVGSSTFSAWTIFEAGLIWFLLPISLVVCNDCFAYVCGFFFGRTPLIRLSPKKTWEGFVGGAIITLVFAFWWCRLIQNYNIFVCPQPGLLEPLDCDVLSNPDHALYRLYHLVPLSTMLSGPWFGGAVVLNLSSVTWLGAVYASPMQVHAVFMAMFASIVGPFGGFFASGFKRAFKIKDFGDAIPGHGGFTDRMDCQLVMGIFTYVYFLALRGPQLDDVLWRVRALTSPDQLAVFNWLKGSPCCAPA